MGGPPNHPFQWFFLIIKHQFCDFGVPPFMEPPIGVFLHHRPNVVATLDKSTTIFTAPLQL